jgi:hypothetical protein
MRSKLGWLIPAVLEQQLNSDLPGFYPGFGSGKRS